MTTALHIARFVAKHVIVRGDALGGAVRVMPGSGFAALVGGCKTT